MPWYALSAVDDATDATRRFLFPFSAGRWLRLAVVALFVGAGAFAFSLSQQIPISAVPAEPPSDLVGYITAIDPLAALAIVLLLCLTVAVVVAGPVLRFVLLDALRTDRVVVRERFRRRFWMGVRLQVFTLATGVLLLVALVSVLLALTSGGAAIIQEAANPAGSVVGLLVVFFGLVVSILVAVCLVAFFHFTTVFVPPTMVALDSGVVTAWGRLYGLLRAHPGQFVGYLLMRLVFAVVIGTIRLFVLFILGGLLSLVAVVLAAVGLAVLGEAGAATPSFVGQALTLVVFIGLFGVYFLLVELPLRIVLLTFVTSYELSVLGGIDRRLAILGVGDAAGGRGGSDSLGEGDDPDGADEFVFDVARPVESETDPDGDDGAPGSDERNETPGDERRDDAVADDDAVMEEPDDAGDEAEGDDEDASDNEDASDDEAREDDDGAEGDDDWDRPYWRT
jgi:hypothetical protein